MLDIYATSIDYDPSAETSQTFFAAIQNKMHWAAHSHTAAEVVALRADASRPRHPRSQPASRSTISN